MNNVLSLNRYAQQSQPAYDLVDRAQSPLLFTAYERPLFYKGKEGTEFSNTQHKALVRVYDDKPVCLNVVKNSYKVVQNEELFTAIDSGLRTGLSRAEISSAEIKDRISYQGSQCFREYIFRDIAFASPEQDKIAFRVLVQNGFGTGAIKMYAGAIDFFCTNGMVLGEYTSAYAKHTSGVLIGNFERLVAGAVNIFWKHKEFWNEMAGKRVKPADEVKTWLKNKFGERLASKLFRQYLIECESRKNGDTLWALYSALTYYASHNDGEFGLRTTVNDHAAATMMKRENYVRKIMDNDELMLLAA